MNSDVVQSWIVEWGILVSEQLLLVWWFWWCVPRRGMALTGCGSCRKSRRRCSCRCWSDVHPSSCNIEDTLDVLRYRFNVYLAALRWTISSLWMYLATAIDWSCVLLIDCMFWRHICNAYDLVIQFHCCNFSEISAVIPSNMCTYKPLTQYPDWWILSSINVEVEVDLDLPSNFFKTSFLVLFRSNVKVTLEIVTVHTFDLKKLELLLVDPAYTLTVRSRL